MEPFQYCPSLIQYRRRSSRQVRIGNLLLGGEQPIRLQSMTTTDTMDTAATVEQSIRIIEAGGELVRVTAPGVKEANNLGPIREALRALGHDVPLVADIHFNPKAALVAAEKVEKVRINPGNFADKKNFEQLDYTDDSYAQELERIREKFVPLVRLCQEKGAAMRIGTNHGSLSDRIMSRYGDTPLGMVESTMEFLRICVELGYHEVVISMKASNTRVMVQAYRLLVHQMDKEGMDFPIHLGVTEAGEGEDGRIKSAVGIGAVLADGIGDTVRVSLTEDPEFEIPVARDLVLHFEGRERHQPIRPPAAPAIGAPEPHNPFEYEKRASRKAANIGGEMPPAVVVDLRHNGGFALPQLEKAGYTYGEKFKRWRKADTAAEYVVAEDWPLELEPHPYLGVISNAAFRARGDRRSPNFFPLLDWGQYLRGEGKSERLNFVRMRYAELDEQAHRVMLEAQDLVLVLETDNLNGLAEQRAFFHELRNYSNPTPVILRRTYREQDANLLQIKAASDFGPLLIDGFGDGIWLENEGGLVGVGQQVSLAFGILQASRVRTSKTEYISCPSCGRTLFDLQETTAKVRARTAHLKGLKIAVMGCIVNGPGEMADADYGYVGMGVGKITLYKQKEIVKKNIPAEQAVEELVHLIQENGDWVEPG